MTSLEQLGELVKAHRELLGLTQDQVVDQLEKLGTRTNRSVLAHLEQGIRSPRPELLESICQLVRVPQRYWQPFQNPASLQRFDFEEALSELIGYSATLDGHEGSTRIVVEQQIATLFRESVPDRQTRDRLNSILIAYGAPPTSAEFFERYLRANAFGSIVAFDDAVEKYQHEAIRLFSTLAGAFRTLNECDNLASFLAPIHTRDLKPYTERDDWETKIENIPNDRLADLGYASAPRLRQEAKEREALQRFLTDLAGAITSKGKSALSDVSVKQRNRMDSFLRKFETKLRHGLSSPLFAPDPDELLREAAYLAPKSEDELRRLEDTQAIAMRNLARYLAADHLDVYVATSMRVHADFVSVNHLVTSLFLHDKLRPLKLRYFNPTQSWIEDRIAKGLVEALMLRRADVTIYMAQKSDTFGKDSEASVALGQGKPVIVYVPKFVLHDGTDSETLFRKPRSELIAQLDPTDRADIDDAVDDQSIVSTILEMRLSGATREQLDELALQTWADFDLRGEADRIEAAPTDEIQTMALRAEYRRWLDGVIASKPTNVNFAIIRPHFLRILIATAVRFEERARLFREIHPLALQVILSSGVLNGIIVARSIDQCATILSALLENELRLIIKKDEHNYRLIEEESMSTIRVISRHRLLRHGFEVFYRGRK